MTMKVLKQTIVENLFVEKVFIIVLDRINILIGNSNLIMDSIIISCVCWGKLS